MLFDRDETLFLDDPIRQMNLDYGDKLHCGHNGLYVEHRTALFRRMRVGNDTPLEWTLREAEYNDPRSMPWIQSYSYGVRFPDGRHAGGSQSPLFGREVRSFESASLHDHHGHSPVTSLSAGGSSYRSSFLSSMESMGSSWASVVAHHGHSPLHSTTASLSPPNFARPPTRGESLGARNRPQTSQGSSLRRLLERGEPS